MSMHRSKEAVWKALSWLRPGARDAADDAPFADAWRLDATGAPQSLERADARDARSLPGKRPARTQATIIETRPVQELRPAAAPRTARKPPPAPEPQPAPAIRRAAERRPAVERRPSVEHQLVQQLRTIQELRQVH